MNIYICMESHTHDVRTAKTSVYICLHLSTPIPSAMVTGDE